MSATLESKATDLAADIGKLGATALRIKEERDALAKALHQIGYEPIGHAEDSAAKVLVNIVDIARVALAQVQS